MIYRRKVKSRRLREIVDKQQQHSHGRLLEQIGQIQQVLIEKRSKKSALDYSGRNDLNATVVFPAEGNYKPGDYANVLIERCTTATLIGKIVG